ncbi:CPBP family intramembrane glutamic endopeptidase [Streptococcus pluranimalium]|uniref:CPBP family intramembrane glutamic endopeptidase n=1 Tax=Streptococcus TaxID=1301 RepID=UPI0014787D12|nr:CPBP family intramembrane glutamic endopeptidase [Streptococcus hyovaginalis]
MIKKIEYKSLVISLGLIVIASLCYALGTSILFIASFSSIENMYLASLITFMILGFIVLPYTISRNHLREEKYHEVTFDFKQYVVIAIIIFMVNHFFIQSDEYFHQMIISMCEEFLFRYVIYRMLRRDYNYIVAILLTSILFGFILHMDYPIIDNLLIRTPLGILFSIFATKFGLQYAIASHWLYNLIVSKILF